MNRIATTALTALAPLAWGSTYAVTTQWLPPDRPLFAALARALPAGLLLAAMTRVRPHGSWWGRAAVLGALNIGVFFPLLFLAAYRLPGGVAAVCGAAGPLFAVALSAGLLRETPTRRSVGAALTGALGVAMVVLRPGAGADAVGLLAGLGGAVSMAAGTVLTKRWGRPEGVGPLAFTGWQLTAGGLLIAPVALLTEGLPPALDGRGTVGYAYLAVANTAVAYALWFRGIGRLPAASVSLLTLLSTVSAAAIGWIALGQALGPVQVAGVLVALGGTVLGQRGGSGRGSGTGGPVGRRAGTHARPGQRSAARDAGRLTRAGGCPSPASGRSAPHRAASASAGSPPPAAPR
ncbi:EamA family transporter [Actinacidiphila yeochonensis]|uniref:EamA family transporter n=1 Tax=Actinacidiphila yeochonensis TaxID=89050 RepID=UPI00055B3637|nr:EamA family transporter [Actinacidiphila yeochonensis]